MNAKRIISSVVESDVVTRIPMAEVIREYSPGEYRHWFDRDTLNYFKTKLDQAYRGPGGIYFVAIHKGGAGLSHDGAGLSHENKPRVTVHFLNPAHGEQRYTISSAAVFGDTPSDLRAARKVAKDLATGYPLPVGQDALDLSGDLLNVGGGHNQIELVWNSLDKEDFIRKSIRYMHFSTATERNPIYRQARVLGHFNHILSKYDLDKKSVPRSVLKDIHDWVVKVDGDREDLSAYGGSLEHFIAYADYLANRE